MIEILKKISVKITIIVVENREPHYFIIGTRQGSGSLASLSIHIIDGETICIPFTTAQRYNHR